MELAELEADLQEGTRQLKKGKSVLQIRKEMSVRISSKSGFNKHSPSISLVLSYCHKSYLYFISAVKMFQEHNNFRVGYEGLKPLMKIYER